MTKLRIKIKRPVMCYPGSTLQQNYAEDAVHGYLNWTIKDRNDFDVSFVELPNPKPFVTLPWQGTSQKTLTYAQKHFVANSRFRVYSHDILSQRDVVDIARSLKDVLNATEVTFKTDQHVRREVLISSGSTQVLKDDLRNPDVLVKLLSEYHKSDVDECVWGEVHELVKNYLSQTDSDDIIRNTKWSLRHLRFDNTLAYGEDNVINFENLNGIVGIFGPNRSGKSSIVGTIMYGLFNGTDRGSIKNVHVVNTRKSYCYSNAIVNVSGVDYSIERQTTKSEDRKGRINASTALNIFRIDDGEAVDLAGEQRNDTEKVLRKLIGSADDFLLTSLSAQDEIKLFISQGSTKRRQILSKFLDLDLFDRMYELGKNDLNATKSVLKSLPDRDWALLDSDCVKRLFECDQLIERKQDESREASDQLDVTNRQLSKHSDFTPITKTQLTNFQDRVATIESQCLEKTEQVTLNQESLAKLTERLDKVDVLLKQYDVASLKSRLDAFRTLESSVTTLKHASEKESLVLKQQERSLKILDDVPCGDTFPTCKFIKDAYPFKEKIEPQRERVAKLVLNVAGAESALSVLKTENNAEKLEQVEQLNVLHNKILSEISQKRLETLKLESALETLTLQLTPLKTKLIELENAFKNDENAEITAFRAEIDSLQAKIKRLDTEKLQLATERGKIQTIIDKNVQEREKRESVFKQMRAFELVTQGFSRKGIPSVITSSQLPAINLEIAEILQGIVDFTIELETDDESDSTEVYINYGDSRRLIELGSGMEKMIASVAIRVALINVSSLPKTDMFIIDEGFGSLDDSGVEACNRLLGSLKRYFKTIIVITHVEGVKDAADMIIEVTKSEKDAKVMYV